MLFTRPTLDSPELAEANRRMLDIPYDYAMQLGRSAVEITQGGHYRSDSGKEVTIRDTVRWALDTKRSLSPETPLPDPPIPSRHPEMRVQATNETTLVAAHRLVQAGGRVLALNFANGVLPGGGFLSGSRAQEEVLCRSSALYATLEGDPMYDFHAGFGHRLSSDWAILSPDVPVFRDDSGRLLDDPWLLSLLTCAAPNCRGLSPEQRAEAGALFRPRIHRLLSIARAHGYPDLVLGAWGCGAFDNDGSLVASVFLDALVGEFLGAFREVVFAITDWSPERRFLGPFSDAISSHLNEG